MKTVSNTLGSKLQQRIVQLESKVGELEELVVKEKKISKQLEVVVGEKQLHFN